MQFPINSYYNHQDHQQYIIPDDIVQLKPPNALTLLPLKLKMIRKGLIKSKSYFKSYGWMLLKQYICKKFNRSQPKEISFLAKTIKMGRQLKSENSILDYYRNNIIQMESQLRKKQSISQNQSYHDETNSLINELAGHRMKIEAAIFLNLFKVGISDISRELFCDYASCWTTKHFSNTNQRKMAEEQLEFMHQTINTIINMKKS